MPHQTLILTEKDILEIDLTLVRLLKDSEARCALLVDQDGRMLARKGFTKQMDCETLAALIAGSFASTRAMAKLVGESEFSVLFHQGERDHIHNILVDDNTILTVIFDDRTTIGMVRVYAKEISDRIRQILATARTNNQADDTDYGDIVGGANTAIDNLFGVDEPDTRDEISAATLAAVDLSEAGEAPDSADEAEESTELDLRKRLGDIPLAGDPLLAPLDPGSDDEGTNPMLFGGGDVSHTGPLDPSFLTETDPFTAMAMSSESTDESEGVEGETQPDMPAQQPSSRGDAEFFRPTQPVQKLESSPKSTQPTKAQRVDPSSWEDTRPPTKKK